LPIFRARNIPFMSMELDQETPDLCLNCEKPLQSNGGIF